MGNCLFSCLSPCFQKKGKEEVKSEAKSLLEIGAIDIDGDERNLGKLCQGKKCIMVVNVASAWGLTNARYTEMAKLHQKYREQGFEILAFPCNQFND